MIIKNLYTVELCILVTSTDDTGKTWTEIQCRPGNETRYKKLSEATETYNRSSVKEESDQATDGCYHKCLFDKWLQEFYRNCKI